MILERISHSSLKTYLQCPLLFLYRYVLKLELPEKQIHLHFGKCLHKALELHYKEKQDPVKIFQREFQPDLVSREELPMFLTFQETGPKLLKYFLENGGINREIVKTEEKLTFSNVKDPGTGIQLAFKEITGVIDFETKDGALGDYKTSSHKYKQEEVDTSHQPTFYYLLYYLEHQKLPTSFIYPVFLKKRKRDMLQILETSRKQEDITNLILLLNDIHAKIEAQQFERVHDESVRCDCYQYENLLKIN